MIFKTSLFLFFLLFSFSLPGSELKPSPSMQANIDKWIAIYSGEKREVLKKKREKVAPYLGLLREILKDYDLPDDLRFLALMSSEKRTWDILYTDRLFKLKVDWYRDERKDPLKSTIAIVDYLSKAYEQKKDWELVLSDYFQSIRRFTAKDSSEIEEFYALAVIGKNLTKYGFSEIQEKVSLDFEEVKVAAYTDLKLLSRTCNIPLEQLLKLNRELKRYITPPGNKGYFLRIPPDKLNDFLKCSITENFQTKDFYTLEVNGKLSLSTIAGMYKIPLYVLTDLNKFSGSEELKKGDIVKLPFSSDKSEELISIYRKHVAEKIPKKFVRHRARKGDRLQKVRIPK